jgi:CMP/dCMP kinase
VALVITMDGPAASGKGTVGKRVAEHCGLHYIDSGLMYRRVGLAALKKGVDPKDKRACIRIAKGLSEGDLTVNEAALRTEVVSMMASYIAPYPEVRAEINAFIRRLLAREPGTVLDGRAGAWEYPEADIKLYITASAAQRAWRRLEQLVKTGETPDYDTVLADVKKRDKQDEERAVAPMRPAPDAIVIDTDHINADQVFSEVLRLTRLQLRLPARPEGSE